ncbi:MAG: phage baseplate assembly protein V [Candidatus Symbiothrix sp.]|jgi:uncharacterized protein involved in type VI secretion and phage assembly|nr:phage baseplate assembly protein V [Candidatus Symbiothrix sp.]
MNQTKALLTILKLGAKPVEFVYLELDQCFMDHHRVKILLDLKQFGEDIFASPMQKTSLVNEKVIIDIQEGEDMVNAYTFSGIITDIQIELDKGNHGLMYVYAASPTIQLERGRMMQTFSDTYLSLIAEEVTKGLCFETLRKPKFDSMIKFSMQYKETDFQYLKRLAYMYGEKLFYSGEYLVFGEHKELPVVKVTYDLDLSEVKFETRLIANTFQQYYLDEKNKKSPYEHPLSKPGTFAGAAGAKSSELNIMRKPDLPMDVPVFDDDSLKALTQARKERAFTDMFHVTGQTKLYKVRIGGLLEINFHNKMKVEDRPGRLRVVRVKHVFDELGKYHNEFDAVPEEFGRIPYPEMDFPVAHAIPATVVANEDPDGLGKVQVKFDFDVTDCDYWMPLATLTAGSPVENRGFVFVPELYDKVLVSFFEGNPEFPFIMGSMFHGKNGVNQGGGKGNHIKTILTRSGHTIEFNDNEQGNWGITVKDKNDNCIHFDTNGKSIRISAPEKISIVSKDIEIIAENQLVLHSEKDTQQTVGTEFNQSVGGDTSLAFGKNLKTSVDSAMELTIKKDAEVTINGGLVEMVDEDIKISSSGSMEVQSQSDMTLKSGSNVYIAE